MNALRYSCNNHTSLSSSSSSNFVRRGIAAFIRGDESVLLSSDSLSTNGATEISDRLIDEITTQEEGGCLARQHIFGRGSTNLVSSPAPCYKRGVVNFLRAVKYRISKEALTMYRAMMLLYVGGLGRLKIVRKIYDKDM